MTALNIHNISNKDYRDTLALLKSEGWSISKTQNGHLRFIHKLYDKPIFGPTTPSCNRSWKNLLAQCRLALKRVKEKQPKETLSDIDPEEVLKKHKAKQKMEKNDMPKYLPLQRKAEKRFVRSDKKVENLAKKCAEQINKEAHEINHKETDKLKDKKTNLVEISGNQNSRTLHEKEVKMPNTNPAMTSIKAVEPHEQLEAQGVLSEEHKDDAEQQISETINRIVNVPDSIMDVALDPEILALVNKIASRKLSSIEITADMVGEKIYYDGEVIITKNKKDVADARPAPLAEEKDASREVANDKITHQRKAPDNDVNELILQSLGKGKENAMNATDLAASLIEKTTYKSIQSARATFRKKLFSMEREGKVSVYYKNKNPMFFIP